MSILVATSAWRGLSPVRISSSSAAAIYSHLLGVPEVRIRDEKGQFLDDITLEELGRALCRAYQYPQLMAAGAVRPC